MFENRQYTIINATEIEKIDFDQVLETSAETLRLSVDGTKTFFKYDGTSPTFIVELATAEGSYAHTQMLEILANEEWVAPIEEAEA